MISSGLRATKLQNYDTDDTSTNLSNCTETAIGFMQCYRFAVCSVKLTIHSQ
jgi:hypothetical protein